MKIRMTVEDVGLDVELGGSPIAAALAESIPTETMMSRWGDEYYGPISLGMDNDSRTLEEVPVGTVAYWPTGDALCIFFGPTPMSTGETPRAASAVTVLGMVTGGDVNALRGLGSSVRVTLATA